MNKLIFTAILSGFAGLYAMGQNEIRLMDMDLNKSYQTYGGAVKGKSVTNEPASIQGKTYDDAGNGKIGDINQSFGYGDR